MGNRSGMDMQPSLNNYKPSVMTRERKEEKMTKPNQNDAQKRGQRVRYLREKLLGLSRAEFCNDFDWSPQSLKAWELSWGGGLSEERAKDLTQHLKKYDIYASVPWIMHGIGRPPIAITDELNICEEEEAHIAKELLLFKEIPNTVDTIIEDNTMTPLLHPGDYVGGITTSNRELALNKPCIIVDTTGQIHVRILQKGDKKNFYHLVCFNTDKNSKKTTKNIPIQSVAPIVWIRKRMPA